MFVELLGSLSEPVVDDVFVLRIGNLLLDAELSLIFEIHVLLEIYCLGEGVDLDPLDDSGEVVGALAGPDYESVLEVEGDFIAFLL